VHVAAAGQRGQQQHLARQTGGPQAGGRLDAGHPGHVHIHQDDVGLVCADGVEHVIAALDDRDDLEGRLGAEQDGERLGNEVDVLRDQDARRRGQGRNPFSAASQG
jgi:hypothetical protein